MNERNNIDRPTNVLIGRNLSLIFLNVLNQSNQAIVFESKSVKQKIIGITFCKDSDRHVFFLNEGSQVSSFITFYDSV